MTVSQASSAIQLRILTSRILQIAILAISVAGVYKSPLADPSNDIYSASSAVATSSATLLGFVIAASAAIITVMDKPFLGNLRKTGHIKNLWDIMTQSAVWLGVSFLLSLMSFFSPDKISLIALGGSLGCIIIGFINFAESSKKLLKIFRRL